MRGSTILFQSLWDSYRGCNTLNDTLIIQNCKYFGRVSNFELCEVYTLHTHTRDLTLEL